ncbi:MAG: pyridoxamine 5'-phosphate oxidase family protein [Muribaculaceae bacterium]|nr:pyridoxamine 5'-phosphate oxidase family protein [Muribaculaceae bacterium]
MERKMRRFKQQLDVAAAEAILLQAGNGILSLVGIDGEPYGVPISFTFDGERYIYFHSAVKGYKIDCIKSNPNCSFCVVGQDLIVPEEFTSYFRSVIVNGTIQILSEHDEILKGLKLLCEKYSPGIDPTSEISKCINHVAVLRLDIENITGKEAIELVRNRKTSTE